MIGDKIKTEGGGRDLGPRDTDAHPGIPKKKRRGTRCAPRTDLASMNRVFVEKTEYIPVKITSESNQQCMGRMIDISESGSLVAVPVILQEGETILVSFTINKHSIAARATVKRLTTQGGVNFVGLQFAILANVSREFVRALSAVAMLDTGEIGRMKKLLLTARQNC